MTALSLSLTRDALVDYTAKQAAHFFPDGYDIRPHVEAHIGETLGRLQTCINSVRAWPENRFDHLHSTQYCQYLYYLSNTIWKNTGDVKTCTKLFLLNKTLNAIDCFYELELPKKFFIGHSVGIVLSKATYNDYFVLYQNSTVGKNHGVAPVIEAGVVMYPNTAIIGRSHVRERTVLSQGTGIVNRDTPGHSAVFVKDGDLVFNPLKRDILADIFRL